MRLWPKFEREYRSSLATPSWDLKEALGVTETFSSERVTETTSLGLAAVFSAVEQISEAIGSLPLKVFRILDDDERTEAKSHRSYRMLHDMPNDYTTAHTFWSTVTAHLLLRGNAFLFKLRDELDMVEQLLLLDPNLVTVQWTGREKLFKVTGPPARTYTADEVLHITGFSLDGMVGCSRIEYCKNTLGSAIARTRFEGEFYSKGAKMPGVIEYPGRLGDTGVENLSNSFKEKHEGKGKRHGVPILEEGAHWQTIGMSLEDMQFVEGAQLSRSDIATLFNLPASYLNGSIGDSLTYQTVESNQIQFATQAVAPLTNRIARALSSDPSILPWNVMYAEFTLEGLMRADMKTRIEYWKGLKDMGVVDNDYIAARENLPKPPKEKPVPVSAPGEQPIPPALAARAQLMKAANGN